MRKTISILTIAAVMAVGAPALAQCEGHAGHADHKTPAKTKTEVKCPVMGGKIKNTKTALKSTYKGKTYYFCCAGCKPEFDKNPAKYVKKTASPKK